MQNSFTGSNAGVFIIAVHFCGNKNNEVKTVLPPTEEVLIY